MLERFERKSGSTTTTQTMNVRPRHCLKALSALLIWVAAAFGQGVIVPTMTPIRGVRDVVWDATRSRLFVSTETGIVMVNPDTGTVERTVSEGEGVRTAAVSDDGRYLYAALETRGVVQRYRLDDNALDLEIVLGAGLKPTALIVPPGRPDHVLMARNVFAPPGGVPWLLRGEDVALYRDQTQRGRIAIDVGSFHSRPGDGAVFGLGVGNVYRFDFASGLEAAASFTIPPTFGKPVWNGNLAVGRDVHWGGAVFDVERESVTGRVNVPDGGCVLGPDAAGGVLIAEGTRVAGKVARYATGRFVRLETADVTWPEDDYYGFLRAACEGIAWAWGDDGVATYHSSYGDLVLFRTSGLEPVPLDPPPSPVSESSGAVMLPLHAADLVFDEHRNVIWAAIPGNANETANSVVSIDPRTGVIRDIVPVESDPDRLALSSDGSRLFALSASTRSVSMVDLSTVTRVQSFRLSGSDMSPTGLVAVPGSAESVVVAGVLTGVIYGSRMTVYDGGVPRPRVFENLVPDTDGYYDLALQLTGIYPGDAPDSLYAANTRSVSGNDTHGFYRMRIDASGVGVDRPLTRIRLNDWGADVIYDDGRLFTSAGEMWTADTAQMLRRFGSDGIPVVFSDLDTVVYVQRDGVWRFTISTGQLTHTLPLKPATGAFGPHPATRFDAVGAGPSTVALAMDGAIRLVDLADLPSWPRFETVAPGIEQLHLRADGISAVPGTDRLLLTMGPLTEGGMENMVATLDASTRRIERTVFAGLFPGRVVAAADGSVAYTLVEHSRKIARIDLASNDIDLEFSSIPAGRGRSEVFDMAVGANGMLAVSYRDGAVAAFVDGAAAGGIDANHEGPFAPIGLDYALFDLEFDSSGAMLYGARYAGAAPLYELKRMAVSPDGVRWLSSAGGLLGILERDMSVVDGRVYVPSGRVIDPERSRVVGLFAFPDPSWVFDVVRPIVDTRRIYFASNERIAVFDMETHDLLAVHEVIFPGGNALESMVQLGDSGLAIRSFAGDVFLVDTTAIPMDGPPIPSPQPTLPQTPGVRVVDIATRDLGFDRLRGLIYAATPNSEAAMGDRVVAIDPASGNLEAVYPAGLEPRTLVLSGDASQLHLSHGRVDNVVHGGFSFTSESVRTLDLATGELTPAFAVREDRQDESYGVLDLIGLEGQPQSVVVVDRLFGRNPSRGEPLLDLGPTSIRVFDGGVERATTIEDAAFECTAFAATPGSSELYCVSEETLQTLRLDSGGVSVESSVTLDIGDVPPRSMVWSHGRLYADTGVVIDTEAMRVLGRLEVNGPVAMVDDRVFWLDLPSAVAGSDRTNLTLRSFDTPSLLPLDSKVIGVTSSDAGSMAACGENCVAFGAGNELYIVDVTPPAPGALTRFSVPGGGGISLAPQGASPALRAGYGRVQTGVGATAPAGLAIIGFRMNGILVSEAGVPASAPVTEGRIFAEIDGPVRTGLALANPNDTAANVAFYFTDGDSVDFGHGRLSLGPRAQMARFLDDAPFDSGNAMRGTFTFSSDVPVAGMALRGFTNERSEFLMTTLPVGPLTAGPADTVYFPHFAAGGGWTTQVILINPTHAPIAGNVRFLGPGSATEAAAPATLTLADGRNGSTFPYSIPPRSATRLRTSDPAGLLQVGSVRVAPESGQTPPSGVSIFAFHKDGMTVSEAGVPASTSGDAFRVHVEARGTFGQPHSVTSGIAVTNTSSTPTTVSLELTDLDGNPAGLPESFTIPGSGHVARSIDQFFPALTTPFSGVLRIASSASGIAVVGLRLTINQRHDIVVTTTPPADENAAPAESDLFFPHLVDSGGWSTQFILFSRSAGRTTNGLIRFTGQDGQPLELFAAPTTVPASP